MYQDEAGASFLAYADPTGEKDAVRLMVGSPSDGKIRWKIVKERSLEPEPEPESMANSESQSSEPGQEYLIHKKGNFAQRGKNASKPTFDGRPNLKDKITQRSKNIGMFVSAGIILVLWLAAHNDHDKDSHKSDGAEVRNGSELRISDPQYTADQLLDSQWVKVAFIVHNESAKIADATACVRFYDSAGVESAYGFLGGDVKIEPSQAARKEVLLKVDSGVWDAVKTMKIYIGKRLACSDTPTQAISNVVVVSKDAYNGAAQGASSMIPKNLLEAAIDPRTGNRKAWDQFADDGGLNKESRFFGVSINKLNAQFYKDGQIYAVIMSSRQLISAKDVRGFGEKLCRVDPGKWKIDNMQEFQSGSATGAACKFEYMGGGDGSFEVSYSVTR